MSQYHDSVACNITNVAHFLATMARTLRRRDQTFRHYGQHLSRVANTHLAKLLWPFSVWLNYSHPGQYSMAILSMAILVWPLGVWPNYSIHFEYGHFSLAIRSLAKSLWPF
jgi:hypothetical protein